MDDNNSFGLNKIDSSLYPQIDKDPAEAASIAYDILSQQKRASDISDSLKKREKVFKKSFF